MNINEIFGSLTRIEHKFKDSSLNTPAAIRSRVLKDLPTISGSGYFSYVRDNPNDINGVTKVNLMAAQLAMDPFYQFAEYIIQHNSAEDNIFIPRIYSVQLTNDSEGKGLYRLRTEKLLVSQGLSYGQLLTGVASMGIRESAIESFGTAAGSNNPVRLITLTAFILNQLKDYSYNEFLDRESEQAQKLIEAMGIWKKIRAINPDAFMWDIHYGNFMWRPTGTGLQLVLTDLLANHGQMLKVTSAQDIIRKFQ